MWDAKLVLQVIIAAMATVFTGVWVSTDQAPALVIVVMFICLLIIVSGK